MRCKVTMRETDRPLQLAVGGMELTIDELGKEEVLTIVSDERGISLVTESLRTAPESVTPEVHEALPPCEPVIALTEVVSSERLPETLSDSLPDETFFQKLSAVRRHLAQQQNVPPYIIFNDKSLWDMIQKLPTDMTSFGRIRGVGSAKLEKYGVIFLKAIAEYMQTKEVLAG